MEENEVKVFGIWFSVFSKRVEIALKMKGVEYEYMEEDPYNKSPSLVKYNPIYKLVPVFLHNQKPIPESQVILEYIDETWNSGTSILPKDPIERAAARFWSKFIDDEECTSCTLLLVPRLTFFKLEDIASGTSYNRKLILAMSKCFACVKKMIFAIGEEREKAIEELGHHLKMLEEELKEKKFFGGDSIGLVDLAGTLIALWLRVLQEVVGVQVFTTQKFPKLGKWADEYLNCSVIKETLPPRAKLLDNYISLFQSASSSK